MSAVIPATEPERPASRGRHRWLYHSLLAISALLLMGLALDRLFPLPLPTEQGASTVVLARDGTPLRAFADAQGIWRYPVELDQLSPLYLEALLAYEDRWFWQHPGINPIASLRAAAQMLWHRRIVSGGSTLTMQVARILEPQPRSIGGKLRQSLRALQLEAHLSKREILTLYLDRAPFGGTLQGVEAASWAYLGKPAQKLSHAEAALLTVLPQAPSRWRPDRHATAARAARDKVLARMASLGVWSAAQINDARMEPVVARSLQPPLHAALLAERLRAANPRTRRIDTTIDIGLQRALEARVQDYLVRLPERTSAALLVVDNRSLETLAYVGSASFADQARLGHVDMVRAWRSPGSTLKPMLFGLALDDGLIHSESLLVDAPQSFGSYRPGNFDLAFNGPVSAATALRLSLNVPAVDLLDRVGSARFAARMANVGLSLRLPRGVAPNLSMILGGTAVRMEDLVGAYTAFNRAGVAGRVRYQRDDPLIERRMLSPGAAWIVREILQANPRPGYRPGTFETGSRPQVAWKTGTSYGFRDAWAVGGTRQYTVAAWIGRPDGTPLPGQYGAVTALPLMFQVIDSLPRSSMAQVPEAPPASVSEAEICWPLGVAFDPLQVGLCHHKQQAWVLDGVIPPTLPERDSSRWSAAVVQARIDTRSGLRLDGGCSAPQTHMIQIARWPALAYPWLSRRQRIQAELPAAAPGCDSPGRDSHDLRIDGLADNTTLVRAPNSAKPVSVRLRALGTNGGVAWLLDGKLVADTNASASFELSLPDPGEHTLTALSEGGGWAQVHVRVLR